MDENNVKTETTATENEGLDTTQDDALKSFLERDNASLSSDKEKSKKLSKSTLWIIIGTIAVLLIIGIVIVLRVVPQKGDIIETEYKPSAEITLSINEEGEHQAEPEKNEKGKIETDTYGTLLDYVPAQIKRIDVENDAGSFTILAETPIEVDEETGEETSQATIYTLVGFENIELKGGAADTVANDVAAVHFTQIADPTGKKADNFGFDNPRAVVKTEFTDGTTSTVIVGDKAPSELGSYLMFGDSEIVYIVSDEAVDGFLFSTLDLVTREVNKSAADVDSYQFKSLTLSGDAYGETIKIIPNEDKAIDTTYVMTKPYQMFVNEVEGANISGAIRGLMAEEVMCVNPSSSQLSSYGLSNPYAQLCAVFPDTEVNISLSQPDGEFVYLIADSNIIYKIKTTSVPWVNTTLDKLTPDIVIDPNFSSLTRIVVKDNSGTYDFDVTTVVDTVENTDGETEEVEVTTAKYKDKEVDYENFRVFYQNICSMQSAGNTDTSPSGSPALTIELSYSTGRDTDVIEIYPTGNSKYVATLNGKVQSLVFKSYCDKFSACVQDLIKGRTVPSI